MILALPSTKNPSTLLNDYSFDYISANLAVDSASRLSALPSTKNPSTLLPDYSFENLASGRPGS